MSLSVPQREAVRAIADGNVDQVNRRTLTSLERQGLVRDGQLTARGRSWHEHIMFSGDGPEALKALLRF